MSLVQSDLKLTMAGVNLLQRSLQISLGEKQIFWEAYRVGMNERKQWVG